MSWNYSPSGSAYCTKRLVSYERTTTFPRWPSSKGERKQTFAWDSNPLYDTKFDCVLYL